MTIRPKPKEVESWVPAWLASMTSHEWIAETHPSVAAAVRELRAGRSARVQLARLPMAVVRSFDARLAWRFVTVHPDGTVEVPE